MIRAEHIRQNLRVLNLIRQPVAGHKVVNPPAGIPIAGMEPITPPGIDVCLVRVKMPESIHEAGL